MKANVYVNFEFRGQRSLPKDEYLSINKMIHESDIEDYYSQLLETYRNWGRDKAESLEGFKLSYLFLTVEFDGRKRKITDQDILKSMVKQGYAIDTGTGSIFGNFCYPTKKLVNQLDEQFKTRKQLIKVYLWI